MNTAENDVCDTSGGKVAKGKILTFLQTPLFCDRFSRFMKKGNISKTHKKSRNQDINLLIFGSCLQVILLL